MEKTRIDKWLWMVRLFKTRTLANEACLAGKVKIQGNYVKQSKEVVPYLVITVSIGQLQKTIEVIDSPKNRISASLVPNYYIDKTPQEEYDRVKMLSMRFERREQGLGRPTKRDRRQLDYLKDYLKQTEDWEDDE